MNSSPSKSSKNTAAQPEQPNEPAVKHSDSLPSAMTSGQNQSENNLEVVPTTEDPGLQPLSDLGVERQHPIPPPSEPMQYRAVGLVQGIYTPSEEQFTKGMIVTADGTEIDAVLLGRVMSLLKNHLNLEDAHLWVVYPRTRQEDGNLHAQIMGVWEPEKLSSHNAPPSEAEAATEPPEAPTEEATAAPTASLPDVKDGYFSIRGEVIYQSQEEDPYIVVKIRQAARKANDKPKFFKLKLKGTLEGKAVGHFWDLHIQREGQALLIETGNDVGMLRPKKFPGKKGGKKPFQKKGRFGGKKPGDPNRPPRPDRPAASAPPQRKEPLAKPVKRNVPPKSEG